MSSAEIYTQHAKRYGLNLFVCCILHQSLKNFHKHMDCKYVKPM